MTVCSEAWRLIILFRHPGLAFAIRDSAANEREFEINLAATRALGFVATHISGNKEPDGVGRFVDYPSRLQIITLEAKSSKDVPTLSAIDFACLHEHMLKHKAQGRPAVSRKWAANVGYS